LGEVGMRVIGGGFCKEEGGGWEWTRGVEGEVEKAIGKAVCFSLSLLSALYTYTDYYLCIHNTDVNRTKGT